MSELIQKKKQLTFEEICPTHSQKIANWDKLHHLEQSAERNTIKTDADCCIVGEAHGWRSENYDDCYECGLFCADFPSAFFGIHPDLERFEYVKEKFVEHFNEAHVK